MARKRMIDPEFWSDEEIGGWSFQARLFYIGLWNFADDEGRFKAHPKLLKSQIFPYDERINIESLKKEVSCKIQWYESNNQIYGYLLNFLKHQRIERPSLSKLPIPPQFTESSPNPHRILGEGSCLKEVNRSKENLKEVNTYVETFFSYFLLKTKKQFKFTKDKADLIKKRLSEGYTVEQLKRAVDNFVEDEWEGRNNHCDLIYCIGRQKGKPDNLEKWLNKQKKAKLYSIKDIF